MEVKKKISLMLVVVLLVQILLPILTVVFESDLAFFVRAEDGANTWDISATKDDNVTATFDEETGILTISGTGNMENWEYENKAPWYEIRESIKEVIIEEGITSIGDYAFANCTSLTSIEIPEGVTSIGICAFGGCTSLTSIEIPDSVINIKNYAFYFCASLENIEIPENVNSIGASAFEGCTSLTNITIPENLTNIEYDVFEGARITNINSSILCDTFLRVLDENNELYYDENIEKTNCEIEGNTISLIDKNKNGYINITNGILNGLSIMIIPNEWDISETKEDNIKASFDIKTGELNIYGTGNAKVAYNEDETPNFELGDMEAIEEIIPWFNLNVKKLIIGKNVNKVEVLGLEDNEMANRYGNSTFKMNINKFIGTKVEDGNRSYCDIDGVLFNRDKTELIKYPGGKEQLSYIIPPTVNKIRMGAFMLCEGLTNIELPDALTSIEMFTFDSCRSLKSIKIPYSVKSIEEGAFILCNNLKIAQIIGEIESIGNDAFFGCDDNLTIRTNNAYVAEYCEENNINYVMLPKVTSEKYSIKDFIENVKVNTTVKELLNSIETNGETKKIYNKIGEEITETEVKIGTGMKMEFTLGKEKITYPLVVIGDLNGDGQVGDVDLLRLARYKVGLDTTLMDEYLQAADLNGNKNLADDIDLLMMARALVGLYNL